MKLDYLINGLRNITILIIANVKDSGCRTCGGPAFDSVMNCIWKRLRPDGKVEDDLKKRKSGRRRRAVF